LGEVAQGDSPETEGAFADALSAHQSDIDLPPLPDTPIRILDDRGHLRTLEEIERDLIQHAIEVYAGHMSEIARRLGIGRSTLYRKVREQGLEGALKDAG
jgi:DNA-binding NtrC family response regulator